MRIGKASGSQIAVNRKRVVACPECLAGAAKSGDLCACGAKAVSFDSRGEFKHWCVLKNAERVGAISVLARQVRYPLRAEGGEVVGHLVLDYVFVENGAMVHADYKGGAMTELARWKLKHFEAQYGWKVRIVGGK